MATIIVTSGPGKGSSYPLGHRSTVIGRDEGLLIQILDEHVSRKHMRIRFEKETSQYLAQDMESRHGTFINGRKISSEIPLADNDLIDIGGVTLLFTMEDFADPEAALNHWRKVGERIRGTMAD